MEYWIYKNCHNQKYRVSPWNPDTDKLEDAEKYCNTAFLDSNGRYSRVSYNEEIKNNRKLKLEKLNGMSI